MDRIRPKCPYSVHFCVELDKMVRRDRSLVQFKAKLDKTAAHTRSLVHDEKGAKQLAQHEYYDRVPFVGYYKMV